MIHHPHPKRLGLFLQITSDTAHAQYAQHLTLWVVAERGCRVAAPVAAAQGLQAGVEVAQGAEEKEDSGVGGGGVDGGGDVGDEDGGGGAGRDVDLVVAGACWGDELRFSEAVVGGKWDTEAFSNRNCQSIQSPNPQNPQPAFPSLPPPRTRNPPL